ncbi:MAG: Butyrate kinase 2 [candidate division WS2 bacterium]|uniref:Probable butyrate kinase n=1 Tax=Psychracetigena formicireducens TaxID=2986056 RepID=A0A9E2BEN5_PSYF1|nr:Butyrate kinase 2 [Candidatus Psychracetigena formicireducens]MBT9144213.1 Butyrate kinase 2 [Candidatus Psychracetigena formicireducens]
MYMYKILVVNPGSTSTKISYFIDEKEVVFETLYHKTEDLLAFPNSFSQMDYRLNHIKAFIGKHNIKLEEVSAFVGRGGVLPPLPGGTYLVDKEMVEDLKHQVQADHPSNLAGLIVAILAQESLSKGGSSLPLITDPVSVDEFEPLAYLSGLPEIKRKCLSHALNMKAVVRQLVKDLNLNYFNSTFIVVNLGSGISISPMVGGRIIDVNNANEGGPFSIDRAGSLPTVSLIDLCFSGKYSREELINMVTMKGGIFAYLGTKDLTMVENKISEGDDYAKLVFEAMVYQIAKEIGAMCTVVKGKYEGIIITGGMSRSALLVNSLKERISFLGKIFVYPGEEEMLALAQSALRVLRKEEEIKIYKDCKRE